MMQFIAKATSGAYLARTPPVDSTLRRADGVPQINLYHKTFFCWIFQRDCDLSKIDPWMGMFGVLGTRRVRDSRKCERGGVGDCTPRRADGIPQINLYHKTFFCWIFQRDCDLSKIDSWMGMFSVLGTRRVRGSRKCERGGVGTVLLGGQMASHR